MTGLRGNDKDRSDVAVEPVAMEYDWVPTYESVRHLANALSICYFTRPRELLAFAVGIFLIAIAAIPLLAGVHIARPT